MLAGPRPHRRSNVFASLYHREFLSLLSVGRRLITVEPGSQGTDTAAFVARPASAAQAARAKLDRLIEGRREPRAQEPYAARIKLETEVVATELRVDAPNVASPPAGQVDIEQAIRDEERRQAARELEPPGS